MRRRVVITGVGLVTPLGCGVEPVWQALLRGESGAGEVTLFDPSPLSTTFACEVKGWDPTRWIEPRLARTVDRFIQFALAAAAMARQDAGLSFDEAESHRVGAYIGSGMGGITTLEGTARRAEQRGHRRGVSAYFVPGTIINLAAGQVAIQEGARGPNVGHASACSSGAHAIGDALRCIQYGEADVMYAGGSEATICALGMAGFCAMKALSRRNDDPRGASRPFDAGRDGFVIGEGAGVLVLEEEGRARRRGARIYAELSGYARNADAHHITAPAPGGEGARRCMSEALRDAGIAPEELGYINAHGTSTRQNDASETTAIKGAFGAHARALVVGSTKSMTGHLLGAAGGLEAAVAALAVQRGQIPPTINYRTPDPDCDLDYAANEARQRTLGAAMSNSFGFGGTNVCLVLRRYTG